MGKEMNGKWMLNGYDDEYWNAEETFDTKDEAIEDGLSLAERYNSSNQEEKMKLPLEDTLNISPYDEKEIRKFDVGRVVLATVDHSSHVFLGMISDSAYEEYGEFAEGYLSDVTDEHKAELEELIHGWFVKHNYFPTFYRVYNIETIDLEDYSEERKKDE